MPTLSQKETELLKDLKSQEQLCIDKYAKHASCASDGKLKNLFSYIGQVEQGHLDTLCKIESGQVPQTNGGGPVKPDFSGDGSGMSAQDKKNDTYLCSDVLAMEKHASSLYDTCIFEFKDAGVRCVLNHIQKEEQEHGQDIYDYMSSHGLYC